MSYITELKTEDFHRCAYIRKNKFKTDGGGQLSRTDVSALQYMEQMLMTNDANERGKLYKKWLRESETPEQRQRRLVNGRASYRKFKEKLKQKQAMQRETEIN